MNLLLSLCLGVILYAQDFSVKHIMSKPDLWGQRVSSYSFSPSDSYLYYDRPGEKVKQVTLPSFRQTDLDTFLTSVPRDWFSDSLFIYRKNSNYYSVNEYGTSRKIIAGQNTNGRFLASKNLRTRVLLDDHLLTIYTDDNLKQFKLEDKDGLSYNISSISDDGNYLLYTSSEIVRQRTIIFPNYLPTFTDKAEETRSLRKFRLYLLDLTSLKSQMIHEQSEGGFISSTNFGPNSKRLIFMDWPIDRKTIQYYTYS
ncbi:MAG: hypothetical protein KDD94_11340, partial [Calditrichaeota bacterium]|nr:hypothetical protein [Calditrichota bacterium]